MRHMPFIATLNFSRYFLLLGLAACLSTLGGCKTTDTFTNKTKKSPLVSDKKEKNSSAKNNETRIDNLTTGNTNITSDHSERCPQIELVNDLKELHQFSGENNYDQSERIATVTFDTVKGECQRKGNKIAIQIEMRFDASLGPKSRVFDKDQPTISYPYFIAVTDSSGEVVDKELHGVSLRFSSDENSKAHLESFKKIIDLKNISGSPPYLVMVGFQLSPEELRYNQIYRAGLLGPDIGRKPDFHQSSVYQSDNSHL